MNKTLLFLFLLFVSVQVSAQSSESISLDEKWMFRLSPSEAEVPANFQSTTFNDSRWTFQQIPGLWTVPTAWAKADYVGIYRGWVKVPATWKGKRAMLHMGLTTSVADIYMNGTLVGQTDSLRAHTELDVTSLLKAGQRNLLVIRMRHYDAGETADNTFGHSGIVTDCYLYALAKGQEPHQQPTFSSAAAGIKVADRRSFEPEKGFTDTPERVRRDIQWMRQLGFGAVSAGRLTTGETFLSEAQQAGLPVVSSQPTTRERLVDRRGQLLPEAYRCLPEPNYNFADAMRQLRLQADAVVAKPKPKLQEDDDLLTLYDTPYSISFDKHTGLIASYTLQGTPVISGGGTVMPNARHSLVSLLPTKPSKDKPTRLTAIYRLDNGQQLTWVYEVYPSGVLTIHASGSQDILTIFSSALTQTRCQAQDLEGDTTLQNYRQSRPRVYWWQQADNSGHGVEVIGNHCFESRRTSEVRRLLIHPETDDFELSFFPLQQR